MKYKEIPQKCRDCINMKVLNLHMGGDHDYICSKKPASKVGEENCDKYKPIELWIEVEDIDE